MDVVPRTQITTSEINQAVRKRAEAELALVGGNLVPTQGAFIADIVYVSTRTHASLSNQESDALAKATAALGYNPMLSVMLSLVELADPVAQFDTYIRVLGPGVVVFLEQEASALVAAVTLDRESYIVGNFFGSLVSQDLKREAWSQMLQAKKDLCLR